jgi:hypothetical protein
LGLALGLTIAHNTAHPDTEPTTVETLTPVPQPSLPDAPPPTSPPMEPPIQDEEPAEPLSTFAPFRSYLYGDRRLRLPLSDELQEHKYRMCLRYDVPYRAVMGLMGVEAGWNANIGTETNGNATYVGLGMLRDIYNVDKFAKQGIDIYTPKGNIEAICITLRAKLDEFDDNIHHALMAYNLGSGGARSKIKAGINETGYSRKVLRYADSLV